MKKDYICPNCKSHNVIEIVYGDPTDELIEEYEKGNVYLAGCVFDWDDPGRMCKDCGATWGKVDIPFIEKIFAYKARSKKQKGIVEKFRLIKEVFFR